ncbi:MAG TPA: hypothetical protein VNE21_04755 [Mycobacteriales bacterium]|nr:hypothetical protein [Mycobacteriales bacterium]
MSPQPVPAPGPPTVAFTALDATFVSDTDGWVLGGIGCTNDGSQCPAGIEHTTDGGFTWRGVRITSQVRCSLGGNYNPGQCVSNLRFADPLDGWAFNGANSSGLLSTHDGGRTWRPENFGHVDDLKVTGSHAVAAVPSQWCMRASPCPNGQLWRSPVGADAWRQVAVPGVLTQPLVVARGSDVWIVNPSPFAAPVGRGAIFVSTDSGASFQRRYDPCTSGGELLAPTTNSYLTLDCAVDNESAGTWRHTLFRSLDGGRSWTTVGRVPTASYVESMSAPDRLTVYLAELFGDLIVSRDGGYTWHTVLNGRRADPSTGNQTGTNFDFVGFQDATHGLTLAGGTAWFTEDNGGTWRAVRLP